MNEDLKYVLSIAISILIGGISYLMTLNLIYGVLLSIIVFLIILILYLSGYKRVNEHLVDSANQVSLTSFLENVYPHRGALEKEREIKLISEAKENVKVLGISHRTLWAETEDFLSALMEAGYKGIKISFLILDPNGNNLAPKAADEGDNPDNWKNEIENSINRFIKLKQDHPPINLEVYTYDIFPIWHMVIIDDNIGLIGYYPSGKSGSSSPLYLINKSDLSLLTPFIKCFDTIKFSGNKIIPKED